MSDFSLENMWPELGWPTGEPPRRMEREAQPAVDLSDVTVELRIELGRLELSIEELLDLTPGARFQLTVAEPSPVALYLGEDLVVEGLLVCEGDEVFLEIERSHAHEESRGEESATDPETARNTNEARVPCRGQERIASNAQKE